MADFGQNERPQHLFIVRIWQEKGQIAPGPWRGSAEHVPTGQRVYFFSLADMSDFIALRSNNVLPQQLKSQE